MFHASHYLSMTYLSYIIFNRFKKLFVAQEIVCQKRDIPQGVSCQEKHDVVSLNLTIVFSLKETLLCDKLSCIL